MARIRTIKPEFWQDEDLAALDAETRLLAIGLLNHSDDEGYFKAHPALINAVVFPFSETSVNIHGMLMQLSNVGYLRLFEGVDGKKYGEVVGFTKHQKVNRPSPSKIKPLESFTDNSLNPHGALTGGKEQGTGKGTYIDPDEKMDEKPSKKKPKPSLDYSSWPSLPDDQKLKDWKQVRRSKKAPITQTALDTIGRELTKAQSLGFSVNQCFEQMISSSWQGFKAEWMTNNKNQPANPQPRREL